MLEADLHRSDYVPFQAHNVTPPGFNAVTFRWNVTTDNIDFSSLIMSHTKKIYILRSIGL